VNRNILLLGYNNSRLCRHRTPFRDAIIELDSVNF